MNVNHLEIVTQQENVLRGIGLAAVNARKTHCLKGHKFTKDNTCSGMGNRACRTCGRERALRYYHANKSLKVSEQSNEKHTEG